MPETTKKPIKIVPNTIKTIPKIKPATIIPKKTLEEQLEEIYNDIDVNVDDLPDELLEVYEELEGTYKEKSIQKNWKLWLSMFTPFILSAFIKGVSGQVTLPYDARQSVQSNAPEPKVVVDHAKRYFESRGLELVKTLSKTDCERLKVQLKDNWGKGPDAFKKSFQEDYANTKARLDSIYRTEYVTAQNEGILARSRDAGHKMKQWNAALDERTCPVCGDQLHGTIIPIDEEFTAVVEHKNGSEEISVNGPPAHPNCRCVLTTLNEEDYDEIKEDSAYLEDVFETIKLNYKCKAGTVDDSNKCEPIDSKNNHIESYSKILESKVPKKFGDQVYLVRMGSEKENNTNIAGNVFVGNNINILIKKALESSKESGNLIIGRCSKDAFEDDELDKISKNDFSVTSRYLGQSFSPVDVVIDTGTSDTIYKRSKDELEKEKNLFSSHESQLNKIEQNTALSDYRNFGYRSVNNVLRKNYIIEGENKKSILDPTPVYSKEYIDKALKNASLISDAMEPSKENKTLKRADGAAVTATLFPVSGITEELTNYFKTTYEKGGKYPKTEDILSGNIKPPLEKTWDSYFTSKLKDLEFKDPAFSSTSKSESGIKEDLLVSSDKLSPHGITSLLDIEVPKGIRLVDMQERLGIGEGRYKTEKEVLLDKNTIFKIKSVKLEPHDNGMFARIKVTAIQKLPEPIKENSTSNNILVYFENHPIKSMDIAYLYDVVEYIKLNYNCPDSEKNGTGPGSCGGNKPSDSLENFKLGDKPTKSRPTNPDRFVETKLSNNITPELSNKITSVVSNAYKNIPELNGTPLTTKNVSEKEYPELKNAFAAHDSNNIYLNDKYFSDISKMEQKLSKEVESGFHPKGCNTAESIITHELGHLLFDGMAIRGDEKWDKISEVIQESKESGELGKVSKYALSEAGNGKLSEAASEIFVSIFHTKEEEQEPVVKKVKDILFNKFHENSSYLEDASNFIKQNYKCPKGTVDDSNKCPAESEPTTEKIMPRYEVSRRLMDIDVGFDVHLPEKTARMIIEQGTKFNDKLPEERSHSAGVQGLTTRGKNGPEIWYDKITGQKNADDEGIYKPALHELGHSLATPYFKNGEDNIDMLPMWNGSIVKTLDNIKEDLLKEGYNPENYKGLPLDTSSSDEMWADLFTAFNNPRTHLIMREALPKTHKTLTDMLGKSDYDIDLPENVNKFFKTTAMKGWNFKSSDLKEFGISQEQYEKVVDLISPSYTGKPQNFISNTESGSYTSRMRQIKEILVGIPKEVAELRNIEKNIRDTTINLSNSGISDQERNALMRYKTQNYFDFNTYLRKGEFFGEKENEDYIKQNIEIIDSVMSRSKLVGPITTYRYVSNGFAENSLIPNIGKTITEPGYMSTTYIEGVAKNAGNGAYMKMSVPQGIGAIELDTLTTSDMMEYEVLLERNLQLEIKDHKVLDNGIHWFEVNVSKK